MYPACSDCRIAPHVRCQSFNVSNRKYRKRSLLASPLLFFGRLQKVSCKITGALHKAFGKVLTYSNLPKV
jgi:hypothetical protein